MAEQVQYKFGTTWWGKRWIEKLESFGWDTRITRGRNYARRGNVLSMNISSGLINAKVIDNDQISYRVKVGLAMFKDEVWEMILDNMANKAIYITKLFVGEMPEDIEEIFEKLDLSLFPTDINDVYSSCSCSELGGPCRHIATVYYMLTSVLDEDPFLLFELRGLDRERLIEGLRERRTIQSTEKNYTDMEKGPLDEEGEFDSTYIMDRYWDMQGDRSIDINVTSPIVDESILKRLGDPPFIQGKGDMIRQIESSYKRVRLKALNIAYDNS